VRGNEILFRSECCRAIIRTDRAFLFPSRWGLTKRAGGHIEAGPQACVMHMAPVTSKGP
jgi:hypothetical protein